MVDIKNFLICSLIAGLPISFFPVTIFCCNTTKKGVTKFLASLGIIAVTSFSIGLLFYCEAKGNYNKWNGGFCPNCQTAWRFSGGSHYRNTTHYYYVCDNCGKVIELTQLPY